MLMMLDWFPRESDSVPQIPMNRMAEAGYPNRSGFNCSKVWQAFWLWIVSQLFAPQNLTDLTDDPLTPETCYLATKSGKGDTGD